MTAGLFSPARADYHSLPLLCNPAVTNHPILLGVNVDHIATIRQARRTRFPDPVQAALLAEQAGADGITMHLREDRRHIVDSDVKRLREVLLTRLNLEMALTDEMLDFACEVRPHWVCLVPEKREELTTEGGLDLSQNPDRLRAGLVRLQEKGIAVSLFIDPDRQSLEQARELGARCVELHTGAYADQLEDANQLKRLVNAAAYGDDLGLQVNAGHGLHYHNVQAIAAIPQVVELNIGHAIVARALFTGLAQAVADMRRLMLEARGGI